MVSCRECGAQVPDIAGPTHDYVPSAPGCWAAFGQVQADALTRFGSPRRHGTVVDCYMAQHPGDGYERRSRQSPIVHLLALSLLIEHGIDGRGAFVRMARLLELRPNFQPLAPRTDRGRLTILDMRNCADAEDYAGRAETWACEIWRRWVYEQDTIRNLVSTVL